MTDVSRKAAERFKERGNSLFKKGKYEDALREYSDAITAIDSEIMTTSDDLKASCLLNMAVFLLTISPLACVFTFEYHVQAVNLKLERWEAATKNCDGALKLDEKSLKAFLRRAQASMKLGRISKANDDLKAALAIESDCKVASRFF